MIAAAAWRVDAVGLGDRRRRPGRRRRGPARTGCGSGRRRCSRSRRCMSARVASSMSSSATTSETAKRPPGRSTRAASRENDRLVGGQVDDAVGDHDVDRRVGQRDVLEVAAEELDVVDAGLGRVGAGQVEHLVGHVQPDRRAAGATRRAEMQHVGAAAGAEVEHCLAGVQVGNGGRHAAAQRCLDGALRRSLGLLPRTAMTRKARVAAAAVVAATRRGARLAGRSTELCRVAAAA